MKSNYAIIFHTQSDYEAAFSIIKSLNPDDIDSEEWCPGYLGSSKRADFILRPE
jgi:hypothetical protein